MYLQLLVTVMFRPRPVAVSLSRLRQLQRLDVDALEDDDTAEESAKAPEKQEKGSEGAPPRDVTMGRSGDVMMLSAVQEEEKKEGEDQEDGAPQPPVRFASIATCPSLVQSWSSETLLSTRVLTRLPPLA